MSAIFLVTALLVFPAALLIIIDDKTAPNEDFQRLVKVKAKKIKESPTKMGLFSFIPLSFSSRFTLLLIAYSLD